MTNVLLVILCVLIILQTIYKVVITTQDRAILKRVERLLIVTETHSRLNQENKERLKETLEKMKTETNVAAIATAGIAKEAKEEIKACVEKVPEKVVERIHEASVSDPFKSGSGSSVKIGKLPTDNPQ